MQGRDDDSFGYGESGYDNIPPSQPWGSSPIPPPSQMWSPQSPPPWQQTPQYPGQSSSPQQRNVGPPQSGLSDYRPNMDVINYPGPDILSQQFQSTQSPLSESDRFTWEQIMGTPETSTSGCVETERGDGGGGRQSSDGGRDAGHDEEQQGGGSGNGSSGCGGGR